MIVNLRNIKMRYIAESEPYRARRYRHGPTAKPTCENYQADRVSTFRTGRGMIAPNR